MKGNEFVVKTIVTTELIKSIADKNHITMFDCYTGFKWIARQIVCLKAKCNTSAVAKRAMASWPRTSCATRMQCPPAPFG